MLNQTLVDAMTAGTITYPDKMIQVQDIEWKKHPQFEGVYLKHLIVGENTNGQLSCHMVKIEPGCILEKHVHANQWELHEVIEGSGVCDLNEDTLRYTAGRMTVIPSGTPHAVKAESEGLVLLAKFFPALC